MKTHKKTIADDLKESYRGLFQAICEIADANFGTKKSCLLWANVFIIWIVISVFLKFSVWLTLFYIVFDLWLWFNWYIRRDEDR